MNLEVVRKLSYTAPKNVYDNLPHGGIDEDNGLGFLKPSNTIIDRRRRLNRMLSPDRHDVFAAGEKTSDPSVRTYADAMRQQSLKREEEETLNAIAKKKKVEEEATKAYGGSKRRNRWDQSQDGGVAATAAPPVKKAKTTTDWDLPDATAQGRTPTPGSAADADATPTGGATSGATPVGMAWDATSKGLATSTLKRQRP
ncbi:hypothetical protein Ddye_007747 [Dipteronia dyeriana]|uniref:Uncharacterized protein n=1 Tax=Dipteronia dyeriana TaxID=168575 RepID=A0AAD9XKJ6_9ROSI|nr:hypothetical protein Ddye_007747 [Dipteronia dyeriana]